MGQAEVVIVVDCYHNNPCARLDTRLYPGLDLVVVSSLEYEYIVTYVVAQTGLVYPMCEME